MTNKTTFKSALATEIAAKCDENMNGYSVHLDRLKAMPLASVEEAAEIAVSMAEAKACAILYRRFSSAAKSMIDAPDRGISAAEIKLEMMSVLVSLAVEGADDRWSGRGNDLARSANDARQKQISRIQSMIN
jgi:hypothetical protein